MNPDEQTRCEHDRITYHTLVRVAGWLVRLTFASMSIEIAGIQLVPINLHDTRCAQRGEVSQREAPPSSHFVGPFDAHLYGTLAIFAEAPLLFRLILRVMRRGLFSPGAESCQVVRGHACGHPARNCFDERHSDARALRSRPYLPLSHGLKAAGSPSAAPHDGSGQAHYGRQDPLQPPDDRYYISNALTPACCCAFIEN